jgi:hypothetical protein
MADESSDRSGEAQRSWDEVGKNFADVGRRVGEHYRKLGQQGQQSAVEARRTMNEAVQTAVHQLDKALTSVGNTIRDPEAKDSVAKAVRSLGNALAATFSDVSEEIRQKLGSKASPGHGPGDGSKG